jgi:hypothetical protein
LDSFKQQTKMSKQKKINTTGDRVVTDERFQHVHSDPRFQVKQKYRNMYEIEKKINNLLNLFMTNIHFYLYKICFYFYFIYLFILIVFLFFLFFFL